MDLINRINYTSFLGREFLTWLWYRSDTREGLFTIDDNTVEVWFDAKLTLEAQGDLKESNVVKAENPTDTDEAHAALLTGKLVTEARLRVIVEQKQWGATVKADNIGLSSVKLPALLSREDDDQLYERFFLMEEIEDIVDALFDQFIAVRLNDSTWKKEINAIRTWVHR